MGSSNFFNFLYEFDFYGINFLFHYKKKEKFQTKLGLLLSLLTIIFSIIFIVIYFFDMINKKTFSLYSYLKNKDITIDFSNIPIMIGIIDPLGNSKKIDKDFISINIYKTMYKTFHENENIITKKILIPIELESCDVSIYSYDESIRNEIIKNYYYYNLSNFLCPKIGQNISIKGKFGNLIREPSFLEINLNKCNDSLMNNTCKNNDDIIQYIQNLYFSVIIYETVIDHENYKNPIGIGFLNEFIGIYPNLLKIIQYNLIPVIYKSDNGILFPKIKEYFLYEYKEKYIDFLKKEEILYNYTILRFSINSFDYTTIYKRVYLKITDVGAVIGGWIDFLVIFFKFISQYFSNKTLICDITTNLICDKIKHSIDLKYINKNKISKYNSNNNSFFSVEDKKHLKYKEIINFKKIYTLKSHSNLSLKEKNDNNDNKNLLKNEYSKKINENSKNSLTLFNINFGNPILIKYLEEAKKNNKYFTQKKKISLFDYIIPFICLKKFSKYNLLILYNDVIKSYLSLEQYLPTVEGFSKLYYNEGEEYRSKFIGNLFKFQYYEDI